MYEHRHEYEPFQLTARRASPGCLIYAALVAAWLIVPVAATAETADTASNQPDTAPQLTQIVVTATRRAEAISKVPLSVTAMSQACMDMRGIKDIQDVARFTPGIYLDNSG